MELPSGVGPTPAWMHRLSILWLCGSSMAVVSCPKLVSEAPWWPSDQTDLISMCGVAPFCVSWLVTWIGDVAIAGLFGDVGGASRPH